MKEENKEFKTFVDNIKSKMKKKNVKVATIAVLATLCVLAVLFFMYKTIKFPISPNVICVEWICEEETTIIDGVKTLDSISFELGTLGNKTIRQIDVVEEGDITIVKISGILGNIYSYGGADYLSVKGKKAVYIQGKDENDRMLLWKEGMDIMTKEEWNTWYWDVYALKNNMIRFEKNKEKHNLLIEKTDMD